MNFEINTMEYVSDYFYSRVSQWLEGMPYKHEVMGSSPISATKRKHIKII